MRKTIDTNNITVDMLRPIHDARANGIGCSLKVFEDALRQALDAAPMVDGEPETEKDERIAELELALNNLLNPGGSQFIAQARFVLRKNGV